MQSDIERQDLRRCVKDAVSNQDADAAVRYARRLISTSNKSADVMFCASAFAGISDSIKSQLGAKGLRTFVVRSVTVEPIMPFLAAEAVLSNYVLDLHIGGYGSYADELLSPQSALADFKPDLVLVLLDLEEVAGRLPDLCADGIGARVEVEIEACAEQIAQLLRSFRSGNSARLLFQGLVVPDRTSLGDVGNANLAYSLPNAVLLLNQKLAAICHTVSDCVFFDADPRSPLWPCPLARCTHVPRLTVAGLRGILQHLFPRIGSFLFGDVPSLTKGLVHGPRQHFVGRSAGRRRGRRSCYRKHVSWKLLSRLPEIPEAIIFARDSAHDRLKEQ